MKVAYLGFGDFGKQIQRFVESNSKPELSVYFDTILAGKGQAEAFEDYSKPEYADFLFYIGLGYHHLTVKSELIGALSKMQRKMPSYIHPSAFISPSCSIQEACIIYPLCNLDSNVQLKPGVVLHNSVVVSHNSTIGACSYISPGVIVSGNVIIGENTFIGSGCVVANNLSIGNNCTIGAGSVITQSITANQQVIGNPFRILELPLKLK